MCELLGAALDAAVARVLSIPGLVARPNGQPAYELEFDPEGPAHEFDLKAMTMHRWFNPSTDGRLAMDLQMQHHLAVWHVENGSEPWAAGFNPWGETEMCVGRPTGNDLCADHESYGSTPQIAICRALVSRHLSPREVAGRAFDAVELAVMTKTLPEFYFDEDRIAFHKAMDTRHARLAGKPTL